MAESSRLLAVLGLAVGIFLIGLASEPMYQNLVDLASGAQAGDISGSPTLHLVSFCGALGWIFGATASPEKPFALAIAAAGCVTIACIAGALLSSLNISFLGIGVEAVAPSGTYSMEESVFGFTMVLLGCFLFVTLPVMLLTVPAAFVTAYVMAAVYWT